VTYHITGGTGQSLFSVDANTGVVKVLDSADLNVGSYTLNIDAVDSHGLAGASSTFTIGAVQTDQGGPTGLNFVLSQTGILAADNTSNGASLNSGLDIGTFIATGDPDLNDTFHYTLGGTDAAKFSLDVTTGELFVGSSNLTSQVAPYSVTVTATDQANNSLSPATTVNVYVAGAGNDTLNGGSGIDIMFGQNGSDTLNGGGGSDALLGGPNADTLYGGAGADQLVGGAGKDNFVYKAAGDSTNTATGHDTIYNFTAASVSNSSADTIDFTQLGTSTTDITAYQGQLANANVNVAAHSVAWIESGGNTFVFANTTGQAETQANANMEIILAGTGLQLSANEFLLHP